MGGAMDVVLTPLDELPGFETGNALLAGQEDIDSDGVVDLLYSIEPNRLDCTVALGCTCDDAGYELIAVRGRLSPGGDYEIGATELIPTDHRFPFPAAGRA